MARQQHRCWINAQNDLSELQHELDRCMATENANNHGLAVHCSKLQVKVELLKVVLTGPSSTSHMGVRSDGTEGPGLQSLGKHFQTFSRCL